ncbi:MAG: YjbH domain-containing protein [Symbiopectobacterium sp.]
MKNPACKFKSSFCQHSDSYKTGGGQFETGNFFHGPAALFCGIKYQTPWNPLRFKLQYDGNDYSAETADRIKKRNYAGIRIKQDSPFNIGMFYRVIDNFDTTLSWQRGNTLMRGFSLHTNFNDLRQSHPKDVPPVYAPVHSDDNGTNWQQVARELDEKAGYSDADILCRCTAGHYRCRSREIP